jgi:hypothetical protein
MKIYNLRKWDINLTTETRQDLNKLFNRLDLNQNQVDGILEFFVNDMKETLENYFDEVIRNIDKKYKDNPTIN